jgi:hypothetical protein
VYPALLVCIVLSERCATVTMCRVRTISRKGPGSSRTRTVDRASGVLDGVEDAGNPQRLYAKLVPQAGGGMR